MYLCRMVGSQFSPCANRNFTAPGQFPMNVFQVNPFAVNGLQVVDDDGWSNYHAMQLQFRRRYATGVSMNVNYTYGKNNGNVWADNATQSQNYTTLRDRAMNDGPAPFDVRHVLQAFGTYDLPWGRGRRYEIENGLLDGLVGGWTFGAIFTAQSGTPFRLTSGRQTVNGQDAGVVLANGHTVEEIQNMINIRPHPTQNFSRYWADEALIGPDGRANPEYLTLPTTPGEFGEIIYLRGKNVWSFDFSLNKSTIIVGRTRLDIHITMQNVLNLPVWGTPGFLSNVSITEHGVRDQHQPGEQRHAADALLALHVQVLATRGRVPLTGPDPSSPSVQGSGSGFMGSGFTRFTVQVLGSACLEREPGTLNLVNPEL